ncbi:metalloprotease PmbA [Ketobacter sp. MCCC 1A13808]|uniref:metalloprotease PmbA n=1 Tax=Ketobacter sp. MCCC 1A13808 TaxID=2602738 RepID=UPI0012EB61A1|nr:metalloprotease PmbA [Ketobacter sp. MCCC 1A13808]MVF11255.1 metalloprotease PmbA [Ketobacter sp. MCCC 1A13808]
MDIDQELKSLRDKIKTALLLAEKSGATAEVGAYQDQGLNVSVRNGEVDTVEFTRNHGFAITVYRGKSKGSASTSDFSDQAVRQTVQAALDIAQFTAPDEFSGLADAGQEATEVLDLDLYHPWPLQPQQAIEIAQRCEAAGLAYEGIDKSDGANVGTGDSVRAYGNSHGIVAAYPQSRHGVSCALIASRDHEMERGGWSQSCRVVGSLPDVESIGSKAAQRALQRLGSQSVATGEFPVMFAAEVAGGLIGHLIAAISGGSLYRHASFLEGQRGQPVFPSWMNVYELPHLRQGAASAPIDGDGLQTREKYFIENGRLINYVLSTYSGRKLGLPSTANAGGIRNLRCSATHSRDELLQKMGTGLLVTDLMGQGVNIVTGNYSRGAAGFWVENGCIRHPVSEITVAGNLQNMFRQFLGIGDDIDARGNIQMGSVLVESMTVAGK